MFEEYKIIKCKPLKNYKLDLTFADGKQGITDLKYLVGKGVFSIWNDEEEFKKVTIDPISKTVCWQGTIDLDPVSLRKKLQ